MTDAELNRTTAGWLAGTLPEEVAEAFRAALRGSEPLRERAHQMALGFLLAERSEQAALLQQMDAWENDLIFDPPANTDIAHIELLLNERQDEIELRQNMDAWETDLADRPAPPVPFHVWRWLGAIVLAALLFAVLLVWICSPSKYEPSEPAKTTKPVPPQKSFDLAPPQPTPAPLEKNVPEPQKSNSKDDLPSQVRPQYIALAEDNYRQSAVTTDNLRSDFMLPLDEMPPKIKDHNPDNPFNTGLDDVTDAPGTVRPRLLVDHQRALSAFENRRWPEAVRRLDILLSQLSESEKPPYQLLLGGACFEQREFQRAAAVFSQKTLQDDPILGFDAQRYELLSRLADLPAGKDAFGRLIQNIRQDPENPNRDLVENLLRKIPNWQD
ncbi:MAG: hypothetical protein ACKVU2_13550 [Saprospiraceae bacterium]